MSKRWTFIQGLSTERFVDRYFQFLVAHVTKNFWQMPECPATQSQT